MLLPLAFCRECGQEYLVTWRRDRSGTVSYLARRDASVADDGGGRAAYSDGYLYVSADLPWPRDVETVVADRRVPESWLEVNDRTGQRPGPADRPSSTSRCRSPWTPSATRGRWRGGIEAAFIPGAFRFCLRCGVSYESQRGSDFAKLATLDQEGRSSATTLISMSIVRSLRAIPEGALDANARKLLTFVDNRQDAALQAGHFNDFTEVTMVRGALYRAAVKAVEDGEEGLFYDDVPAKVTRALGLTPGDYATHPGEDPALRRRTEAALRDVVNLRVFLDLERGWRVTMPNLEQVGLIEVGYLGLDGVAARDELWRDCFPALRDAAPEVRERVCRVLLDEMRRSLAIDAECFDPDEFDRMKRAQPGGAAPGMGRRRRRPAGRGDRLSRCRPAGHRPGPGLHVRAGQVRPLPQAGRPVPRLPAGDQPRRRAADHRRPAAGAVRRRRQPAHRSPAPPAARCPRLPDPRGHPRMAARRRRARRR